jgi:hypothetical protein
MPEFWMDARFRLTADDEQSARLMADDLEDKLMDLTANTEPDIEAELLTPAALTPKEE